MHTLWSLKRILPLLKLKPQRKGLCFPVDIYILGFQNELAKDLQTLKNILLCWWLFPDLTKHKEPQVFFRWVCYWLLCVKVVSIAIQTEVQNIHQGSQQHDRHVSIPSFVRLLLLHQKVLHCVDGDGDPHQQLPQYKWILIPKEDNNTTKVSPSF